MRIISLSFIFIIEPVILILACLIVAKLLKKIIEPTKISTTILTSIIAYIFIELVGSVLFVYWVLGEGHSSVSIFIDYFIGQQHLIYFIAGILVFSLSAFRFLSVSGDSDANKSEVGVISAKLNNPMPPIKTSPIVYFAIVMDVSILSAYVYWLFNDLAYQINIATTLFFIAILTSIYIRMRALFVCDLNNKYFLTPYAIDLVSIISAISVYYWSIGKDLELGSILVDLIIIGSIALGLLISSSLFAVAVLKRGFAEYPTQISKFDKIISVVPPIIIIGIIGFVWFLP